MPKQIISKETILNAVLEMTRKDGFDSVNARSVAEFTGRSVQPIYSYFENMEDLKETFYRRAMEFYEGFIRENSDMLDLERMGIANVRFAKEEPNLFRLLFLSKLEGLNGLSGLFDRMGNDAATDRLKEKLKITKESAREIYLMLMIFTHGIATMVATDSVKISDAEIAERVRSAYAAFVAANSK